MNITVKAAREILEAAQAAYINADVTHPTQIVTAKKDLNSARFDYHEACAALCTKLEFSTSVADVESELIAHGLWT
jgi:hypothetical protein